MKLGDLIIFITLFIDPTLAFTIRIRANYIHYKIVSLFHCPVAHSFVVTKYTSLLA